MNGRQASPLIGQMTLFLVLFIGASVVMLLLVGKPFELDIKDYWGNRVHVPVATLIVGGLSIILFAHFAAKFLTKPIRMLDAWAKGKVQSIPDEVSERQDELGHLARSMREMRERLEKERDLIQIDRDIHRSLNHMRVIALSGEPSLATLQELLSVVIGQTNADAAMLVRRDPHGGGFSIISSQVADGFDKKDPIGGTILDSLLPERILVRFLDAFELRFDELDEEADSWAKRHFGDKPGSDRTLINIPVENNGQYLGSLMLVRSGQGLPLDAIRPLAGCVVSSAKYLETSIERDENWTSIMTSLSRAVDAKSKWTIGHSERVAGLASAVGERLLMDEDELMDLRVAALLHDVGKIAIPESIIDKPARLSDEEMGVMKQHPERGALIVENMPGYTNIRMAILHHHERWDGRGYPHEISGDRIPFHARIIAIADVFDAITSDRPYRKGLAREDALSYIESEGGSAFDGALVGIFLAAAGR